nr:hypothetical protein Iba_chr14fCG7620 [Ipomoea batatas]
MVALHLLNRCFAKRHPAAPCLLWSDVVDRNWTTNLRRLHPLSAGASPSSISSGANRRCREESEKMIGENAEKVMQPPPMMWTLVSPIDEDDPEGLCLDHGVPERPLGFSSTMSCFRVGVGVDGESEVEGGDTDKRRRQSEGC